MSTFLKGVQKQNKKNNIKRTYIIVFALVLLVLGGGLVVGRHVYDQQKQKDVAKTEEARKAAAKYNREGDGSIEVEFIKHVQSKDTKAAQELFVDHAAKTSDDADKKKILEQYYNLSLEYGLKDGVIDAATQLNELSPDHETEFQLAQAYRANGDTAKYKQHVEKALSLVWESPQSEERDFLITMYTEIMNDESKPYGEQ